MGRKLTASGRHSPGADSNAQGHNRRCHHKHKGRRSARHQDHSLKQEVVATGVQAQPQQPQAAVQVLALDSCGGVPLKYTATEPPATAGSARAASSAPASSAGTPCSGGSIIIVGSHCGSSIANSSASKGARLCSSASAAGRAAVARSCAGSAACQSSQGEQDSGSVSGSAGCGVLSNQLQLAQLQSQLATERRLRRSAEKQLSRLMSGTGGAAGSSVVQAAAC